MKRNNECDGWRLGSSRFCVDEVPYNWDRSDDVDVESSGAAVRLSEVQIYLSRLFQNKTCKE